LKQRANPKNNKLYQEPRRSQERTLSLSNGKVYFSAQDQNHDLEELAVQVLPVYKAFPNTTIYPSPDVRGSKTKLSAEVEESGQNALLCLNISEAQPWLLREFLGAVGPDVIFSIPSSTALSNFAFGATMVPHLRVEIPIFLPGQLVDAAKLSPWPPLDIARGYAKGAHAQMMNRMNGF
jgi:hypothetical protein